MTDDAMSVEPFKKCLIVVPTLNEARHIAGLLDKLMIEAEAMGAAIVVADGGSTDGTRDIAADYAARYETVSFIDNPKRSASA